MPPLNFCPACGSKLPATDMNFCPNCGASLKQRSEVPPSLEDDVGEAEVRATVHELGEKLEECVEKILRSKGFRTKRREKIRGISGAQHEIDIVALKGDRLIAVECKNWKNPVGVDEIEKFWAKLRDLGPKWRGLFVAYPGGFTEEAEKYADYYNIDRWDADFLKEEFWAISVGRIEYSVTKRVLTVKNALPLRIDFLEASKTTLRNKEKINVIGMLSYHPYYIVDYSFFAKVKDPTKKVHTLKDSGKVFIDGLDGIVLNPPPMKDKDDIEALAMTLKDVVSRKAREESKRNEKLIDELEKGRTFAREYEVEVGNDYKVRVLQPSITIRSVRKIALEYIVQKNTRVIKYIPKRERDELFPITKTVTYVPKSKDINIKGVTLVFVPRWNITFEALGKSYSREVLAFSGAVLKDTLRYCPKHIGIMRKGVIAICEVCGQALCEDHISQCIVCGKWLCEEDGIACGSCKRVYCKEHELSNCEICNSPMCEDCKMICPICERPYCQKHVQTCSNCGRSICPNCSISIGLLRKKVFCKECRK